MSTATPAPRRERRREGATPGLRASRRQPTRSSARQSRTVRTRTIRRDAGVDVPQPPDRLQDAALTLLSIAAGPVLLISGAVILGVPVGSLLSPEAPTVVQQHLPRLDAGLRDAERIVGLGAAGLGVLLSLLALLAALASATLELLLRLGRLDAGPARGLMERLAPGFMRRTLVLTLTAQLAVTGTAAGTSLHHASGADEATAASSISAQDDALPETRSSATAPGTAGPEAADSATADTEQVEDQRPDTQEEPMSPLFTPEAPADETDRHQGAETRDRAEEEVTVRAGDSLWTIAAEQLGPQATDWEIAEHWPEWHQANRDVIGDDPGHLLPGTVLTPPEEGPTP